MKANEMTATERRAMIERLKAQHSTAPASTIVRPKQTPHATEATATTEEAPTYFETCKRRFETDIMSGNDCGESLYNLSVALARSVIRRLIDPQKASARTAAAKGTERMYDSQTAKASDSGCNPVMLALYNALYSDAVIVNGTEYANRYAYRTAYNADGDTVREVIDTDARDIDNELSDRTFSDAHDVVNEIAVALWNMAQNADVCDGWLDDTFVHEVLAKRVYRQNEKTVTREEETTCIREACRAGRRTIADHRSISLDALASLCYDSESVEIDGETEEVYYKLTKAETEMYAYESDFGMTADAHTVNRVNEMIQNIGVRASEMNILKMLMRGKSVADIAKSLGIAEKNVKKHRTALQKRAIECGYIPQGYRDTDTVKADNASRAVLCVSADGTSARFDSIKSAAKITGIDASSISSAAHGKRLTAGGYAWRFI